MIQTAEQQLWCAVIHRAFNDALQDVAGINAPHERRRLSEDALEWFLGNGRDFRATCEAAGLDADAVRAKVIKLVSPEAVHAEA